MRKIYLLSLMLAGVLSLGASCTLNTGPKAVDQSMTGGIFRTADQGLTWKQLGLIPTVGPQKLNVFGLDTSVLATDPGDQQAIYMGTFRDGVFYT